MGESHFHLNVRTMKGILFVAMILVSVVCHSQDKLPDKPKQDTVICNGYLHRSGTRYSGKTYTEIYDVITDSVVNRFGLEFRSADSSFIRKVPMEGTTRRLYDQMKSDTDSIVNNQERMRKETIEFINRYRTSYEVWLYFKVLGILGR